MLWVRKVLRKQKLNQKGLIKKVSNIKMPYTLTTQKRKGKNVFCMISKDTGKKYCYKSKAAREKGMRVHEMFKHMPKKKIRISKK